MWGLVTQWVAVLVYDAEVVMFPVIGLQVQVMILLLLEEVLVLGQMFVLALAWAELP